MKAAATAAKEKGARELALHRHLIGKHTAAAVEANPEAAIRKGLDYFGRSASSFAPRWHELLLRGSIPEICAILRDRTEATEQLRISQPFAGLLSVELLKNIALEAYGGAKAMDGADDLVQT